MPSSLDGEFHSSQWPFREPGSTPGGVASHGSHGRGWERAPPASETCQGPDPVPRPQLLQGHGGQGGGLGGVFSD